MRHSKQKNSGGKMKYSKRGFIIIFVFFVRFGYLSLLLSRLRETLQDGLHLSGAWEGLPRWQPRCHWTLPLGPMPTRAGMIHTTFDAHWNNKSDTCPNLRSKVPALLIQTCSVQQIPSVNPPTRTFPNLFSAVLVFPVFCVKSKKSCRHPQNRGREGEE